jgi:hypothetical protein
MCTVAAGRWCCQRLSPADCVTVRGSADGALAAGGATVAYVPDQERRFDQR